MALTPEISSDLDNSPYHVAFDASSFEVLLTLTYEDDQYCATGGFQLPNGHTYTFVFAGDTWAELLDDIQGISEDQLFTKLPQFLIKVSGTRVYMSLLRVQLISEFALYNVNILLIICHNTLRFRKSSRSL